MNGVLAGWAGGGIDPFTKDDHFRVKTVFVEQERAEQILNQMDSIERSGSAELIRVAKLVKEWGKDDRDHTVDAGALDPVIAEAKVAAETAQQRFLDGLFAMKEGISEKEWNAVFGAE